MRSPLLSLLLNLLSEVATFVNQLTKLTTLEYHKYHIVVVRYRVNHSLRSGAWRPLLSLADELRSSITIMQEGLGLLLLHDIEVI